METSEVDEISSNAAFFCGMGSLLLFFSFISLALMARRHDFLPEALTLVAAVGAGGCGLTGAFFGLVEQSL